MKNNILDKKLVIDREKCTHCGRCREICWNGMLKMDGDGYPYMDFTDLSDEWHMCWECQRCLAGFGKPAFQFPRGVQRSDAVKIHSVPSPAKL